VIIIALCDWLSCIQRELAIPGTMQSEACSRNIAKTRHREKRAGRLSPAPKQTCSKANLRQKKKEQGG
jgi:hypothetical protein